MNVLFCESVIVMLSCYFLIEKSITQCDVELLFSLCDCDVDLEFWKNQWPHVLSRKLTETNGNKIPPKPIDF